MEGAVSIRGLPAGSTNRLGLPPVAWESKGKRVAVMGLKREEGVKWAGTYPEEDWNLHCLLL